MLEESSVVIIILTFDDIQKTRVRQNVLVEIGMALKIIPKDKIYVFSEKDLPKDFPSDLLGAINVNVYNLKNGDLADKIVKLLNLESNKGLLCNQNYKFKYEEVFDGIPANVFEKNQNFKWRLFLNIGLNILKNFH